MAAYEESSGKWYIRSLVSGVPICFGEVNGGPGQIPVAGDYDGDGVYDLGVYDINTGNWYVRRLGNPAEPSLADGLNWGSATMDAVGETE